MVYFKNTLIEQSQRSFIVNQLENSVRVIDKYGLGAIFQILFSL
jgi:hypothetical protein